MRRAHPLRRDEPVPRSWRGAREQEANGPSPDATEHSFKIFRALLDSGCPYRDPRTRSGVIELVYMSSGCGFSGLRLIVSLADLRESFFTGCFSAGSAVKLSIAGGATAASMPTGTSTFPIGTTSRGLAFRTSGSSPDWTSARRSMHCWIRRPVPRISTHPYGSLRCSAILAESSLITVARHSIHWMTRFFFRAFRARLQPIACSNPYRPMFGIPLSY